MPPRVALHFKHNFTVNLLDSSIWMFGDSFASVVTIIPVFIATLTDSPIIIGLVPALLNAGWFLPQMFMAGIVQRRTKKMPLAKLMGLLERVPYFFFPLLAFLLPKMTKSTVLWIYIALTVWRGIATGLVALPWQEVIATVIPLSHRGRFFGMSRLAGQILGVIGSAIAAVVFNRFDYPYNYAVSFLICMVALWFSYVFFIMNIEPEPELPSVLEVQKLESPKTALIDWAAFGRILKNDINFRYYLGSRSLTFIGNMASGFLAVYGIQKFNLSDDQAAIFTGLLFLSGVFGYALWGLIGDRIGPKRIILISGLIWIAALMFAIMSPVIWLYYAVFLLMGFSSAGSILGDIVLVMELGDDARRPTYLGLARTLPGVFLLIAPLFAGWVVSLSGYPLMLGLTIVFTALGLLMLIKVKDRPRIVRH